MKYNLDIHKRRSIRLRGYDYSQVGGYFVTICSWQKECLFGDVIKEENKLNELGIIVKECFENIPNRFRNTEVDRFVIMPNHIHVIIIISKSVGKSNVGAIHELPLQHEPSIQYRKQRRQMLLPKIMGWLKMNSAKAINQIRDTSGRSVWQRNYYERIIRNEKELNRIREYIWNNPLQWHLDEENPINR